MKRLLCSNKRICVNSSETLFDIGKFNDSIYDELLDDWGSECQHIINHIEEVLKPIIHKFGIEWLDVTQTSKHEALHQVRLDVYINGRNYVYMVYYDAEHPLSEDENGRLYDTPVTDETWVVITDVDYVGDYPI